MMKLYAFYSIGGYKDLYLGELKPDCSPTYFLPLLSIMKKRNKDEEREIVANLEALPKIERITSSNSYGFPQECSTLFSHGGYILLYKTLNDGRSCLVLRDLTSSTKDEEGRGTPFNLLFMAESENDCQQLDNVALFCFHNATQLDSILSPAIVYDPKVNGTRADLPVIYEWIASCPTTRPLTHKEGQYNFVMVGSPTTIKVFLKEQNVSQNSVDTFCTIDGTILKGSVVYSKVNDLRSTPEPENNDIETADGNEKEETQAKSEEIADVVALSPQCDLSEEKKDVPSEQNVVEEVEQDTDSFRGDCEENQNDNTESTQSTEIRGAKSPEQLPVFVKPDTFDEDDKLYTLIFGIRVPTCYIPWIIIGTFMVGYIIGRITL